MGSRAAKGPRPRAAAAVAVVAALAIAGLGWAIASDTANDTANDTAPSVRSGSGGPNEYAQVLRLDEGRAGHVSVSSSDQIEVWWQDPGKTAWSVPEVINGGSDRYLTWTNVRLAGTTVAIRAFYNTQPPWDDEYKEPGVATSVFIVCRPGACVASDHYEHVQSRPVGGEVRAGSAVPRARELPKSRSSARMEVRSTSGPPTKGTSCGASTTASTNSTRKACQRPVSWAPR